MNIINNIEDIPDITFQHNYKPHLRYGGYRKHAHHNDTKWKKQNSKLPDGITKEEFVEKYRSAKTQDIVATAALYGTATIAIVSFLCCVPLLGVINGALCAFMLLDKKFMKEYHYNKDNVCLFRDIYNKIMEESKGKY